MSEDWVDRIEKALFDERKYYERIAKERLGEAWKYLSPWGKGFAVDYLKELARGGDDGKA